MNRAAAADAPADPANASTTYTLRRVQTLLGLSRTIVDGLITQGFITPTRGRRNEWRFTFQDLMLLRAAHALQAAQIPPRRILRSLARLKATLPDTLPLSGLRITAIGDDVAVRSPQGGWQADSGQLLMDFDVEPAGHDNVAFLQRGPRLADAASSAAPDSTAGVARASAASGLTAAAWFDRGVALEMPDPTAAEAAYRQALALAPGFEAAYLNLGALLSETGRFDELAALSQQALAQCPDSALVHFNLAVALDHLDRLDEAVEQYEQSLTLDPTLADAHYNLGRLREQLGDPRGALRHFSAYRRLQR